MRALLIALALAGWACGETSSPEPAHQPQTRSAPESDAAPSAAAEPPAPDEPEPATTAPDPDFHLDPDPEPTGRDTTTTRRRRARPIELILRSSPPGATASIDGQPVGKTPTYWAGETDGRSRDVTFALPGYAVARYRFVATRSGVVHGTLRKLAKGEADAGPQP